MSETRKLAAILVADVVGYSRLAGADEERTLARLRGLRSDLVDPSIAAHRGRIVKRTGDGSIIEFRSVVDAVRCAVEIQNGMAERNAGVNEDRRIEFRIGIHLGDVVEESDGDLMGDGVNIAARLEAIAKPGTIFLSEDAYRQVRDKVTESFTDLGEKELKNIARPVRVYELQTRSGSSARAPAAFSPEIFAPPRLSIVVLPFANIGGDPEQEYFVDGVTESLTTDLPRMRGMLVIGRNTAFTFKGKAADLKRILGRSISCVGEVICAFCRGEAVEQRADGSPGLFDGSGVGLAQQGLHFCEDLFNRIEVWRVGGQEKELGFGRADGGANSAALVTAEVVHFDDNVAWRWDPGGEPARRQARRLAPVVGPSMTQGAVAGPIANATPPGK